MDGVSTKRDLRLAMRTYVVGVLRRGRKPSAVELKDGFKESNPATVDSHTASLLDEALLKIMGEILRGLVSLNGDKPQLTLPLDLADLNIDGVISFDDGKVIRWSDIAQATAAEVQSHLAILREQRDAITSKYNDLETLWKRVRPLMHANPKMTVSQALSKLARR